MDSKTIVRLGLLALAAVAVVAAVSNLRDKRATALLTVDDIEQQLAALDPITRSAVISRLSVDAVHKAKEMRT